MLTGLEAARVSAAGDKATDTAVDVMITDVGQDEAIASGLISADVQIGVVSISPAAGGDVQLDRSVLASELQTACRLLAEIVRLRRTVGVAELARDRWADLAYRDELTALPNRRAWNQAVQEWKTRPDLDHVCVTFFDLDRFKSVNDRCGHAAGDNVLAHVGARLLESTRDQDVACRLGGDEFGVLFPYLPPDVARGTVDRIRRSLLFVSDPLPDVVTASAGYCGGSANQLDQLIARGDAALRQAKSRGRDQSCGEKL